MPREDKTLDTLLDMQMDGGTVREHLDSLPKADRDDFHKRMSREYLKLVDDKDRSLLADLGIRGLSGVTAGVMLGSLFGAHKGGRLTPNLFKGKHPQMAGAAYGAAMGMATTIAGRRERKKKKSKAIEQAKKFMGKAAAEGSRVAVKKLTKMYGGGGERAAEFGKERRHEISKDIINKAKKDFLLDVANEGATSVAPIIGAAALAEAAGGYYAADSKDDPVRVYMKLKEFIKDKFGKKEVSVQVIPGSRTAEIGRLAEGPKKGLRSIKTPPNLGAAYHEAGHLVARKQSGIPEKAIQVLTESPYRTIERIRPGTESQMVGKVLAPKAFRPFTAMPYWAIAGMAAGHPDAQKYLGDNKFIKAIGEHPEYVAAAGVAPLLAEEAAASAIGAKELFKKGTKPEILRGLRSMGLGFSTYALGGLGAILAGKALGEYYKSRKAAKAG